MQLSCLPVSFFPDIVAGRMTLREWARMGAELGLDAIDVSILFFPDPSEAALREARQAVEGEGMSITMMSTYPDFTHPDAAHRRRELEQEVRAFDLAAQLGVKYVRVTAGQAHPETAVDEGIGWAAEGMHALVERIRGMGPQPLYENHGKPGVWQYTDFSTPADLFMAIFRATEDISLGINYDTANAAAFTDDPLGLLDQIVHRVQTVHAADTSVKGSLQGVIIGQGIAPFPAVFNRLQRAGFDNWICIEENAKQGRRGVDEAAKFIRRCWAEVEASLCH